MMNMLFFQAKAITVLFYILSEETQYVSADWA